MQEHFIYALTAFTVEKRAAGWYFAQSAKRHRSDDWRGPYRSEASIARQLRREIAERYQHQLDGSKPARLKASGS